MQQLRESRMFLQRALEHILADKDSKKTPDLRRSCEEYLEQLKVELSIASKTTDEQTASPQPSPSANHTLPSTNEENQFVDADYYFAPFKLACTSKSPRIVTTALDCIQKLVAYGHLRGRIVDPDDPKRPLAENIVSTVCGCFQGEQTQEGVQLQIIKALLTCVTSVGGIEVHEGGLVLAVRTVYNIHVASRSLVNQDTAKAALTQMLSLLFSKMEQHCAITLQEQTQTNPPLENNKPAESDSQQNAEELSEDIENDDTSVEQNASEQSTPEKDVRDIVMEIVDTALGLSNADVDSMTSEQLAEETLLNGNNNNNTGNVSPPSFVHISHKDALLVFRALCKMSMKPLVEGVPDNRSHEYRSKVLSLILLLSSLQNAGPVFRSDRLFIEVIKHYLCVALSKNGVSPVAEIFELSLNIFLALYANFKQHLKVQIEVFIREIFLNILESPMSSFEHKWIVVGALKAICSEPQNVVDIYLNYDCDLSSANVFERLISDLSKIAQGLHASQLAATPVQTKSIRIKGLECMVDILRCMVKWSHDLYFNPHDQSNLADRKESTSTLQPISLDTDSMDGGSVGMGDANGSPARLGDSTSSLNSDTLSSADNPTMFENIKQQKEVLEQGIDMFNRNSKKGLHFLQNHGLLSLSPEKVASFLHQHEEKLDPTMMGDFLGEGEDFNKAVMYAYVDQFDYSSKDFVTALRGFLEGFRLPGEAQKIDRLMEKFASRYCESNPQQGVFASADTAYVLAFSIIMLTTDLHNNQIKKKMTKQEYIRQNRGINDSQDLPEEYLSAIYDQIAKSEIKMRHTRENKRSGVSGSGSEAQSEKARRSQYEKEMEFMASTAVSLVEAAASASSVSAAYTSATHYQHVKPMFKIAWTPLLATFSVGLQDCDNLHISGLCLEGIRHAIRIACIFRMDMEKDAYVQALSRFTLLSVAGGGSVSNTSGNAAAGFTEMKSKNIDTIKTLIHVAHTDGNYLGSSWGEVLRCISQLELAQMIGTGVRPPVATSQDRKPTLPAHVQESVQETSSQSVVVAVDRVFTGSVRLDGNAIVDFVTWLCSVSMEELQQPRSPRMFSLTKLVEIAYYNMGRIRLQWSRIWAVLGEHFNRVGCFPNEHVAFFALDSLRQLSMKFIEKGELSGFRFQKEFLRPFEYIMKRNRSPTIRDMVVRCVAQMVQSQAANIKSGWKNIFAVFHLAASDADVGIVELAFQTTARIITLVFQTYFSSVVDSFQDAVKCLSEFTCSATFPDTSMEAIRLIRECAHYVHINPHAFSENWNAEESNAGSSVASAGGQGEGESVWVRGWFPLFFELNCIITRCKLDVRTRALTVMFDLLKTYGASFRPQWWRDLLNVILRLFDVSKVEELEPRMDRTEWMNTTCNHTLYALVDIYSQHFEILKELVFAPLLGQIAKCCRQSNEQLARAGINCLENLLISNGTSLATDQWDAACDAIRALFADTLAHPLLSWTPPNEDRNSLDNSQNSAGDFSQALICCVVQLELIHAIDGILFLPLTSRREDESYLEAAKDLHILAPERIDQHSEGMIHVLNSEQLTGFLDSLIQSHEFARSFNSNNAQRTLLWKAGFKGKNKPNLIQQETSSLACALRLLFALLNDDKHAEVWAILEGRLNELCLSAFQYYITLADGHRDSWTSLLILLLTKILQIEEDKFSERFFGFYPFLCEMIAMDLKPELRAILRKVFLRFPHAATQPQVPSM